MTPIERILVPLDTDDVARAAKLAARLKGYVGGVKLGKQFFTANGPNGVNKIACVGHPIFMDLKFHDIPNTVASAIRSIHRLKPFMLNVHASGGRAMMKAAVAANNEAKETKPLLLGVTMLTSLSECDLKEIGVASDAGQQVVRLSKLAQDCGMDGVVCSSLEITLLRKACGDHFKLVVPGIRPSWSSSNDQKRVATPIEAIARGADYLVIGRPITTADDPVNAAVRIREELAAL